MNICMVSSDAPPNIGGVAVHIMNLSRNLAKSGHNVSLLVPEFGSSTNLVDKTEEVEIHRVYVSGRVKGVRKLSYLSHIGKYLTP